MSWWIERRLRKVGAELARARQDLEIAREQVIHLADDAADAELRAIVSDGGLDRYEATDSGRHRDAMERHVDDLRRTIERLEARQDELLDQLSAGNPGRR